MGTQHLAAWRRRTRLLNASDLYVVITEEFCAGRTSLDVLDAVLDAGVSLVQLREKNRDTRDLYRLAETFRERTRKAGALLIVNDRLDVALAVDADGVHLGQSDLPVEAARRVAPGVLIGASTHSIDQALAAQAAGADYVNIGPIFPTQTKATPMEPLGTLAIREVAQRVGVPFTCMGGIGMDNIQQVLDAGAVHVAVVTAVTAAYDVNAAARELRDAIIAGIDLPF